MGRTSAQETDIPQLKTTSVTDPALNAAVSTTILDTYSGVIITTTTTGNAQTLQSPTNTGGIKRFSVINNDTSTDDVVVNGTTLTPGDTKYFVWDGSAWTTEAGGGGAVEGTAVLSTGEVGGTKFLREDGDGTCSWQTPAGSGDMLAATYDPATISEQLVGLTATQSLSNKTLDDNTTAIADNVDNTKKIAFQASAITTATTRTITMADSDIDLANTPTSGEKTVLGNTSGTNTGDQTITLTGDVTGTGTGSFATTIAAKAVDVAMLADGTDGELITWSATGVAATVAVGTAGHVLTSGGVGVAPTMQEMKPVESFVIACSDESTALTTGTAKVTFRMPYAFTLTDVRASLTGAGSTSGTTTVDINESGTTILSTKLTIDNTEKTSETAATPAVISDSSLADDAEITIDIDAVTGGADETGLKVTLIGNRT